MATTKSYNVRIKNRQDTHANWLLSNPVLLVGEVAIATGVPMAGSTEDQPILGTFIKCGNGESKYSELPFLTAEANIYNWAKAANKPSYTAGEIGGLADYINGEVQDTDTTYQIVVDTTDKSLVKLQSKEKGATTWTDVSTFKLTTVETGTTAGTISVTLNGEVKEVKVAGFDDLSQKATDNETAIGVLNGGVNDSGSVAKAVNDAKTELTNTINSKIASTYKPAGTIEATALTADLLNANNLGKVYNINGEFTTTESFVEGADKTHPSGSNVVVINNGTDEAPVYKFDVLAGFVDLSDYYDRTGAQDMATSTVTTMLTTEGNTVLDGKVLTKKIKDFGSTAVSAVNAELSKTEGTIPLKDTVKGIADASATTIAEKTVSDALKNPANLPDITASQVSDFDAEAVNAVSDELLKEGSDVTLVTNVKKLAQDVVDAELTNPNNLPGNIPTSKIKDFGTQATSDVNTAISTEGTAIRTTVEGIADASAETIATNKINALNNTDAVQGGQFVTAVKQTNGAVTVERAAVDIAQLAQGTGDTIIFDCGNSGYVAPQA